MIWLFASGRTGSSPAAATRWSIPSILQTKVLRGGPTSLFFQYFLQGGLFFAMPLFLSIALGLSAIETGVRLLPLSFTLILAAAGSRKPSPGLAAPRRALGFLAMFAGLVILIAGLDNGAGAGVTTWPMLSTGLGMGALASQLGAITVSSVPTSRAARSAGCRTR